MLSAKKQKCPYCAKSSYFYVYMDEVEDKTAIFTQCYNPKCSQYIDIWVVPHSKVQSTLDSLIGEVWKET